MSTLSSTSEISSISNAASHQMLATETAYLHSGITLSPSLPLSFLTSCLFTYVLFPPFTSISFPFYVFHPPLSSSPSINVLINAERSESSTVPRWTPSPDEIHSEVDTNAELSESLEPCPRVPRAMPALAHKHRLNLH